MANVDTRSYQITALLGEGGFGKVYRASLRGPDGFRKDVAIKLLHDPEPRKAILQRFRDEARILGLVRDRAIVGVDPPTKIGQHWAVVMELVDGASAGVLLRQGAFPPGVAVEIVGEIARVLNKVWTHPGPDGEPLHLLHRDIKPDNIQITSSGEIKLLDFGIAKAEFSDREFKTKQSIGGTPGYMAPERLLGIEGPEGDVFSLGVMLHELVTGARPVPDSLLTRAERASRTVDLQAEDFPTDEAHQPGTDAPKPPVPQDDKQLVLELAKAMCAEDRTMRPVAREIERQCAELRRKIGGPSLRDWAELVILESVSLPADELVGRVVTETLSSLPLTTSGGTSTTTGGPPTPSSGTLAQPGPATTGSLTRSGKVAGVPLWLALFGVAGVLGVGGLASAVVAFGLTFVMSGGTETPPAHPEPVAVQPAPRPEPVPVAAPEPVPVPAPVEPQPVAPVPVPVAAPGPKPVAPAPKPVAPAPEPVVEVPEPTPVEPPPTPVGTFQVAGDATSVRLVDANGTRYGPGEEVPVGRYKVLASFPVHGQVEVMQLNVREGRTHVIECLAAIALCKEKG